MKSKKKRETECHRGNNKNSTKINKNVCKRKKTQKNIKSNGTFFILELPLEQCVNITSVTFKTYTMNIAVVMTWRLDQRRCQLWVARTSTRCCAPSLTRSSARDFSAKWERTRKRGSWGAWCNSYIPIGTRRMTCSSRSRKKKNSESISVSLETCATSTAKKPKVAFLTMKLKATYLPDTPSQKKDRAILWIKKFLRMRKLKRWY